MGIFGGVAGPELLNSMSLVGNLEDLGLGDILQIVSLSRKSGILALNSRSREGRVVFFNGQVIRASSSLFQENLGHLLLKRGLVDLETLKQALTLQKQTHNPPRLGIILSERFGVSQEAIEHAVKEQVEKIVYSFFGWTEGTFAFELGEQGDPSTIELNPLQFMLDQGLNPQWLAMEGSRILDEKRHRGESLEEPVDESVAELDALLGDLAGPVDELSQGSVAMNSASARPVMVEQEAMLDESHIIEPDSGTGKTILLVDDDDLTRQRMATLLQDRGWTVATFGEGRSFLRALDAAVAAGEKPLLILDLIMPRMDGSGILGGLELADEIGERFSFLSTFVLTDHPNQDAELKLREKGFPDILNKPKKDALRNGKGENELLELICQITAQFEQKTRPLADLGENFHHLGRELLEEMGESSGLSAVKGPESPGLHLLKGMLQELNNPSLGGGIILLVLRFASELMNRAVIFLVKEEAIVGLGQFGLEFNDEVADRRVRQMKIPINQPSILASALQMMSPFKTSLGTGEWDRYLQDNLGGKRPQEVFIGPILSEGKVVALIYGDNLPVLAPVGDTESFEIFLSQAGLAMERALLERRLKFQEST